MATSTRLHALDNLRAVMMWLGVVLHVAALHSPEARGLQWRDAQTSPVASLIGLWIHAFRMPVFFVIAGFFVALLVQQRGVGGMLRHRLWRIGAPLVLLGPVVFAALVVVSTALAQPPGQPLALALDLQSLPPTPSGAHVQTVHLWFLYELLGLVLFASLAWRLAGAVPAAWGRAGGRAAQALRAAAMPRDSAASPSSSQGASGAPAALRRLGWVGWGLLALLPLWMAVIGRHQPYGILQISGELLPPLAEWLHYGLYFAFGIVLHHERAALLPLVQARAGAFGAAGAACFVAALVLGEFGRRAGGTMPLERVAVGWVYNASGWLWMLALIGAFLRHLPRQSAVLAYVAESSYWMYLVHLPLVGAVAWLLRDWPAGFAWKMLANVAVTSAVCLLSYQWCVRRTRLGALLGGVHRDRGAQAGASAHGAHGAGSTNRVHGERGDGAVVPSRH